jgi:hypothetical protein
MEAHSIAGNLKDWPEPEKYEGECWLANAPNEEQRTFATFTGAILLYSAPTSAGPDGITKYSGVASGSGFDHCDLQGLVDEGYKCLQSTKQTSLLSCPSHLVFWFDSFKNVGGVIRDKHPAFWLNKVDVWPISTSFLSSLDVQYEELEHLVDSTVSFIKLKKKGTGSWPV